MRTDGPGGRLAPDEIKGIYPPERHADMDIPSAGFPDLEGKFFDDFHDAGNLSFSQFWINGQAQAL